MFINLMPRIDKTRANSQSIVIKLLFLYLFLLSVTYKPFRMAKGKYKHETCTVQISWTETSPD